jgi:hypothetical protein
MNVDNEEIEIILFVMTLSLTLPPAFNFTKASKYKTVVKHCAVRLVGIY